MQATQLNGITALRGIAAIVIVFHHFTAFLLPDIGHWVGAFTPFLPKGYLAVDLFFILSGFILFHVYRTSFSQQVTHTTYKRYLLARLARIYPLHLFVLGLFVGLELFEWYYYSQYIAGTAVEAGIKEPFTHKQTLWSLVTNIFMVQSLHAWSYWNEPAWSISAEWIVYLFIPFLIPLAIRLAKTWVIVGTVACYSALFALILRDGTLDFVTVKSLVRCLAEAGIGMAAYRLFISGVGQRYFVSSASIWVLAVAIFMALWFPVNHIVPILLFPLLILAVAWQGERSYLNGPVLQWLGTVSYTIYITHWFIQVLLQQVSFWWHGKDLYAGFSLMQQVVLLVIAIGIVLVFAQFCYRYIEQPARRWLRQRAKPVGDPVAV